MYKLNYAKTIIFHNNGLKLSVKMTHIVRKTCLWTKMTVFGPPAIKILFWLLF